MFPVQLIFSLLLSQKEVVNLVDLQPTGSMVRPVMLAMPNAQGVTLMELARGVSLQIISLMMSIRGAPFVLQIVPRAMLLESA